MLMKNVTAMSALIGGLLLGRSAQAIQVGAAPAYIFVESPPGMSTEHEVMLINESAAPVVFVPHIKDFGVDAKSGEQIFSGAGTLPTSAASWLALQPEQITVPANGQNAIKVIISAPPGAVGGHYAMIVFEGQVVM